MSLEVSGDSRIEVTDRFGIDDFDEYMGVRFSDGSELLLRTSQYHALTGTL